WALVSVCCPSLPIPANSTCREYLSSGSKQITSFKPVNHYYRCGSVSRAKCNTAGHPFIEPSFAAFREEPVCA
ncbi:MAG TPA: hypothetical protein VN868_05115, partial [Terriglobales bacterium]|nr:hypothetical protein [Terriglobales bacterium]